MKRMGLVTPRMALSILWSKVTKLVPSHVVQPKLIRFGIETILSESAWALEDESSLIHDPRESWAFNPARVGCLARRSLVGATLRLVASQYR